MTLFRYLPGLGLLAVILSFVGCSGANIPSRPPLPPSETDLVLLTPTALCDQSAGFQKKHPSARQSEQAWGSGQELFIPSEQSTFHGEESYFFDDDGVLVGALFTFPKGLDLQSYPVLRRTLSQLKPSVEFYLTIAQLESRANMESSALLQTGDEKTTTQYLVIGLPDHPILLAVSLTIDPYVRLFSPYRREFLDRLRTPGRGKDGQIMESQGSEDKEPFASLQQFARGQTAQLAYCGEKNYTIAAEAYQKAIASGFTNKVWLAEAHHKLGIAWQALGHLEKAKAELLQSLSIRPNTPEVLNNLGTVYVKLGDRDGGRTLFEKAVVLRPNYALARYNLAEVYEATDTKRAIAEYETYLALVEGIPEEEDRIAHVQKRLKALKE